ncbi:protein LLP homolog [Amblyomma americanum]
MAKSLRSKWKRKMRAKKRERYSVKELAKLKEMLAAAAGSKNDSEMSDLCTVVDAKHATEPPVAADEPSGAQVDDETGTMDIDKPVRKYDPKTLRDEHGTYPVWMSQRAIRKLKTQRGRKSRKSASRKGVKKNRKRKSSH